VFIHVDSGPFVVKNQPHEHSSFGALRRGDE
jgi:hypothetical protein